MSKEELFSGIEKKVRKIGELEDFNEEEINLLLTPKKISYSELDVNGIKMPAWRILFNNALGPGKGGIRFHPECE